MGCQIGVTNFIFGGCSGYVGGNVSLQLKIPPSLRNARVSAAAGGKAGRPAHSLERVRRARDAHVPHEDVAFVGEAGAEVLGRVS